jgi:hypothetical protein
MQLYPEYYSIVRTPMSLSTILQRLDAHQYPAPAPLYRDLETLVNNTMAYYTDTEDYNVQRIISRAKALQDMIVSMIEEIDPSLIKACEEIMNKRGPMEMEESVTPTIPSVNTPNSTGSYNNIGMILVISGIIVRVRS